jgi:uncharacterized protein YyaL (SSP411 family)
MKRSSVNYFLIIIFISLINSGCMSQNEKHTNALINETSPYLLQHAHNPVDWHAWNDASLQKAKDENKLMLISIGYSACHWCHVMEHESFEDDSVAKIMNENFICIKVDREERPDIDQVYMHAVQLMTGQGGWPLNCFAVPDGSPVFGGTYFPRGQWINVLTKLSGMWKNEQPRLEGYAAELAEGIKKNDLVKEDNAAGDSAYTKQDADAMYKNWAASFDKTDGGPYRTPKFPMPNNYEFLLRYYYHTGNKECLDHVLLTLDKMAYGGIYDQVGGGFARYSTDIIWKVPHFEKMLYDNAQLVTLYAHAYQLTKKELYKTIVYETLDFIKREMTAPGGGFYSALDADSEGEEGKFYVWTKEELEKLLGDKSKLFFETYNVNDYGLWEHNNYILIRKEDDETIAKRNNLTIQEFNKTINECRKILLRERDRRIRPGLDDKSLTSWNGLMVKAYTDAYIVFGEKRFLDEANSHANFIFKKLSKKDGGLYHSYKAGIATINGFLEDYCFVIEACIGLYEATFDEDRLLKANQLMDYAIKHFQNQSSGMFYFTSDGDRSLITRKTETEDNVIPSSNSSIAKSCFLLGHYFENEAYIQLSKRMAGTIKDTLIRYPSSFSNWGLLLMNQLYPFHEIVIAGNDAAEKRKEISEHYIPNKLVAGAAQNSAMPLFESRFVAGKTLIYVCVDRHCLLPVEKTDEAIRQIKK